MDNYTNDIRHGVRMQAPICERQVGTELIGDCSLPDYQPEIKRLLRVKATVLPPDRYVGAGSAEFTGAVDYTILYAGHDGALYSAAHTEEYRFEVPVELTSDFELGDGLTCDVETVAEAVMGRVSSPRKLSLRCKLRSDVHIWGNKTVEERVDAIDPMSVQRLHGEGLCAEVFCGTGEAFSLQEELLQDAQSADIRVISAEGQVFVAEANAGSDCVSCRGEVYLKLLCCSDSGGAPTVQLRKLPFAHTVEVDGCEVNCECAARGVCTELDVTVEEGRILCNVSVRLSARAQRNRAFSYTRDLYSTESEGENRYTEQSLPIAVRCINGNFTLNTTLTAEEAGVRAGMTVLDSALSPGAVSVERSNGKQYLVGKCRCQLILWDGEDMSAQELDVPFRYEPEGCAEDVTDCVATADALSCRVRTDGERVFVDAELAVSAVMRGENRIRMLSEASFGDAVNRSAAVYTVCYPAREDSLWSVARRYHRPIEAIAEMNGLAGSAAADSPESLAGVAYLLV